MKDGKPPGTSLPRLEVARKGGEVPQREGGHIQIHADVSTHIDAHVCIRVMSAHRTFPSLPTLVSVVFQKQTGNIRVVSNFV